MQVGGRVEAAAAPDFNFASFQNLEISRAQMRPV